MIGFLRRKNDWREINQEDVQPFEVSEEFTAKVEKSISSLNGHIERLNNRYREMLARSREYFERCVEAIQAKDDEKAKIYASEIAEIKKLAGIVLHSQLVLLQVKIRLESILELGEALALIQPLSAMLQNVAAEISDVAPEASENLRNLMAMIDDFMSSAGVYVEPSSEKHDAATEEASFILEQARKIAAEKVRQSFPEVPKLTDIEKTVYSYVVEHDIEELDLDRCASELGLDSQTVSDVLKNLHQKGLIQLEVAEAS
ncbi:MAG: hypothetical protein QXU87_03855 [Candidatus Caldarchaeum sp.]